MIYAIAKNGLFLIVGSLLVFIIIMNAVDPQFLAELLQ